MPSEPLSCPFSFLADDSGLHGIEWRVVVIDEAHRLKNRNCKLLEGLKTLYMVRKAHEHIYGKEGS